MGNPEEKNVTITKQIAVVTGGMGGLGEAISVRLHDAGYAVAVTHSLNNAGVGDWLDRMAAQGPRVPGIRRRCCRL